MPDTVSLSSPIRTSLNASQSISSLQARTQERLSTGNKFNSFVDNPRAVSISKSLSNRASDLQGVKNNIGQGVSKLRATQNGLDTIDGLLNQAKAVAQQLQNTSDPAQQAALTDQFNSISEQVDFVAQDASLGGTSLISSTPDNLNIDFSANGLFRDRDSRPGDRFGEPRNHHRRCGPSTPLFHRFARRLLQ